MSGERDRERQREGRIKEKRRGEEAGRGGTGRTPCSMVATPDGTVPAGNMFSSVLPNTETTGRVATEHLNGGQCNRGSAF